MNEFLDYTGLTGFKRKLDQIFSGKQDKIDSTHKLSADLVDDANTTNKFVTASDKTTWDNKSDFSGDYNDLTNKPTIPTVPTNVSAFINDVPYLTQHQDLSNYIQKSQTSGLVKNDGSIDTFAMTKTVTVDYLQNADTVQWTNLYGNITVNYVAGINVATLKVSHGSVLEQVVPLGSASINIDSNEVVTMKITRTSDLQDACLSMRFVERTA